jgi:S1-C subfamily serine protease
VGLHARVPADAFTAGVLGMERMGNGVLIREDGVVLTIGYLVTEADQVELTANDGSTVAGHVLGFDHQTGFGLVQALEPLELPVMPLGDSKTLVVGERVVVGGAGGRTHSVGARVVAREEFAGYWEYVLDDAIFTRPAHPVWSGSALIGPRGDLLGIGSLHVQQRVPGGAASLNMMVPIELLGPIYEDLLRGRTEQPGRPWLGLFAQELEGTVVIIGVTSDGPAKRAGLREGDIVLAVGGQEVNGLADFYRSIWALGPAGVDVPLTLDREGDVFEVRITSRDRRSYLKSARYH